MVGGLAWGLYIGLGMNDGNQARVHAQNEYLVSIETNDFGRWSTVEKRRVTASSEAEAVNMVKARGVWGRVGKAERIPSEAEIDALLAAG